MKRWILGLLLLLVSAFPDACRADDFTLSGATITLTGAETIDVDGNVTLSNGSLSAGSGTIKFGGNWTLVAATFDAGTSTVIIQGLSASTSTLSGSTTFYSLQSAIAGKGLVFEAASTQTVTGSFLLTGSLGNLIRVRSSAPSTFAYLTNTGTNTVTFTDAQDNNAGGGVTIMANAASIDSGNNINWFFASGSASATPRRPAEIRGILQNGGADMNVQWRAVTLDVSGNAATISVYAVQRSTALFGTYTTVGSVNSGTSYSETVNGQVYFYRVIAVDITGNLSNPSDVVDSSANTNRYVLPADGTYSYIEIPDSSNAQLQLASDGSRDIEIAMTRRTQDEGGSILRSYALEARWVSSGALIPAYSFTSPGYRLWMDYASAITPTTGNVAPYWMNGAGSIRLANPISPSASPYGLTVQNLGIYQLSGGQTAFGFSLQDGSPYPRVLTPNRPNENRRLYFLFNNPNNETIRISFFDFRNRKVRDLDGSSSSSIPGAMVWDARDDSGRIVPSGIYLYKIKAGNITLTGTVVVAR